MHKAKDIILSIYGTLTPKLVIGYALAAILAMCLFPPWRTPIPDRGFSIGTGYAFLLFPPNAIAEVDLARLVIQFIAVAVVAGGIILFLRQKEF